MSPLARNELNHFESGSHMRAAKAQTSLHSVTQETLRLACAEIEGGAGGPDPTPEKSAKFRIS